VPALSPTIRPVSAYETSARHAAVEVVRVLRGAGHVAYFAGGCVRDRLLGKWPADYDVATDAKPDRVRELFRRSRFVGEAFGVVLVSSVGHVQPADWAGEQRPTRKDGHWIHQVEVATFRTEWGYADGRRPTGVEFGDAEHDARRRDFTINGLFEDPLSTSDAARIIDYVGGQHDLYARVLRAIGDPDERFGEDFLRMLRAVRFAARLGFRIDRPTALAIRKHAPSLSRISRERIGQEVEAMLTGPRPLRCVRLMQRLALDGPVLEEPAKPAALRTVAATVRLHRAEPVAYPAMLAAWMIDRHLVAEPPGPDELASRVRTRLRDALVGFAGATVGASLPRWRRALCLPNDQREALRHTLTLLPQAFDWDDLPVARRKRLLARREWPLVWVVVRSLRWWHGVAGVIARLERDAAALFAEGVAPAPLLTGDDLVAMGMRPGPHLGRLLETLYDAQLEGRVVDAGDAAELARKTWNE